MSRHKSLLSYVLLLAAAPGALLALSPAQAAGKDDDYLRAIQEEGNRLETLNQAREELRQNDTPNPQAATPRANPALNTAGFEQLLNREAPATYKLYNGLTAEKRKAVYDLYQRDGNLASAKRKIVELHLGH